ncbi:leukocyte receptor cluster member 1-like [Hibiscus syriacus]|uniref:Leukocyte receptor cluster member 1-like n=1 Tax=Hibiscus syriacus TaxID=106335 RepID=A0A6A2WI66_HIBSY|nr:leukocyte receptor cluster member 1-like [Hibiscus syriacus]
MQAARTFTDDVQDKSPEAKALITKLTEEKNKAIQQNNKLRQEQELLKRESSKSGGGLSFMLVFLIGLVGLIAGYIMKRS